MSVFGSGIRPWKRQTETKRAADSSVPGKGELVVSDTGKVYAGDGATQAKNLSPMLRKTDADATYATPTQVAAKYTKPSDGVPISDVKLADFDGRFARDATFDVRKYGAVFNDSTDDTAAIQAAITACANLTASGGTVLLPSGSAVVNGGLTFPVNKVVRLVGQGPSASGGIFGTRLRRTTAGNPVIAAAGTGQGTAQRVIPELYNLSISGGNVSTTLVSIRRASRLRWDNVRISDNNGGTGLELLEVWDSDFGNVMVQGCGSGTTSPAVVIGAITGLGVAAVSDGLHFQHLSIHSSYGTDLRITGDTAQSAAGSNVQIVNLNMEGTGAGTSGSPDTYPYIDLDYAQNCAFGNVRISMPTGRACTAFIQQIGTSAGPRANVFGNVILDVAGTNAPQRYIRWAVGAMSFGVLSIPATNPTVEYMNLSGAAGRFKLHSFAHNASNPSSGFITDQRAVNEELTKGHVAVIRQTGSATSGTVGGFFVWDFADAASNDLYAVAEIPRDADPNGQCRLRLYWTANDTSGLVAHWRVTASAIAAGGDLSASGSVYEALGTGPPTANTMVVTTFGGGPACNPGGLMSVYLQRLGSQADDTLAATARLVKAEMIYDRRI